MSYYRRKKRTRKAEPARTKEEKCASKWCRNRRALNNTGYYLSHCWKCRSRILKERNPWTYVLNGIRASARKRGLAFTITVQQFKEWCIQTKYLELRGQNPDSMTVDRKDWNEGYHIWNIQPLSHAENSAQGADNTPREERHDADDSDLPPPEDPPKDTPF